MTDRELLIKYDAKLRELGNILVQLGITHDVEKLKNFLKANPINGHIKITNKGKLTNV